MASRPPTMPITPEEWKVRFSEALDLLEQSGMDSDSVDEVLVFVYNEASARLFPPLVDEDEDDN